MDLKTIFTKLQSAFDWLSDALEPIENRWLIFIVTVVIMLLAKAGGASGLTLLIALIYVMYFVTLKNHD
jgi:hypothetical protein